GRRVKMIQARNPVARAAIVKRRLDESENVVGILHHMTVGIDVVVRHTTSFCGLQQLTPNGLTISTSLNGFVNLLRLIAPPDKEGRYPGPPDLLGSPLRARYLGPTLKSVSHLLAILRRGQQMSSRSEVLGNRTVRGEKPVRMAGRFEPL